MELELTTQLVPFINVGMYGSVIEPYNFLTDFENNEFIDELEEKGIDIYDAFNNEEYTKFVYETACEIFNELYLPEIKKLPLNITSGKCVKIHSPRQYNYTTDEL
jgi:hypothetical protein